MTDDLDFYDLLRVDEEASEEEIREGFRQQVREYHPDLNDDPRAPAQFSALKKAYDTLADPKERDAYDRMGHEEYVSNRISGLPSPDAWMVDDEGTEGDEEDDPGTDDGDSETSTQTGRTTTSASTSSRSRSRSSTTETASETTTASSSRSDVTESSGARTDVTGSASTAETAEESTRTTRSRSRTTSPSSTDTTERPRRESTRSSVDPSNGGGHAGTGAGTARGPGMGTATSEDEQPIDDGKAVDDTETATSESGGSSDGLGLVSGLEDAFASAIGWPLILTADALFLASLGLYAAANAEGLNVLLDRLAAAGADPGAIQSALETRPQGFDSLASFLGAKLNGSPVVGMVALVGMAFLPSVYFFMVRWTRRNRLPWQPSYLYVLGALSPIAALVASVTADLPGVYVEVVGFVLVPVLTIFSMLFFAQIKPRIARLYRRWRYKIGS